MSAVHDWPESRRLDQSSLAVGGFLAAAGLAVWTGLSAWSGLGGDEGFRLREAWDTEAYFYLGLPVMALMVALAGFLLPDRAWRWPLWLVGGHQAGVLLVGLGMQSGLSLVILTLAIAVLLAAVFAVPAIAGSVLARRLATRVF